MTSCYSKVLEMTETTTDDAKDVNNAKDEEPPTPTMERIYVGGFQPPLLRRSDFLSRLQESFGSTLDIQPDMGRKKDDDDDDGDDNACFVHLNVTKKTNGTGSGKEQIAKLYNNVTWKGCKLRVESARPHFLERLQEERKAVVEAMQLKQQQKQQQQMEEAAAAAAKSESTEAISTDIEQQTSSEVQPPKTVRRHLKIRERYGEQVFSVDTKPYKVDSWRGMQSLLRKIDRRRTHYQEELKRSKHSKSRAANPFQTTPHSASSEQEKVVFDIRTQPKLNRAVHLRFINSTDDGKDVVGSNKHNPRELDRTTETTVSEDNDDQSISSQASSDSDNSASSSDSSSSSSSTEARHIPSKPAAYVWSDSSDGDDSDSSNDDSDDDSETKRNDVTANVNEKAAPEHDVEDTSSSDEDSDSGINAKENTDHTALASDGDNSNTSGEDSDDEESQFKKKNRKPQKLPSTFDEFESAMDDTEAQKTSWNGTLDGDEENDDAEMLETSVRLQDDVEANLGVMASLFPEMKKMQPKKVAGDDPAADGEGKLGGASGWTAGGIMMRFDPRKAPAKAVIKAEIERENTKEEGEEEEDGDSVSSTESSGSDESDKEEADDDDDADKLIIKIDSDKSKSDSDSDPKGEDSDDKSESAESASSSISEVHDTGTAKTEAEGNVYKQAKLEDVFREAREDTTSSGPMVVEAAAEVDEANAGGFSFGFNLGPVSKKEPEEETKIPGSFSFSFFGSSEVKGGAQIQNEMVPIEDATAPTPANTPTSGNNSRDATEKQTQPSGFRRRGMQFPTDALDRYQEDFYVMNDGLKILQDLDRYRRDPEVKEHWQQERHTLTQDWKRKRKHAHQARSKHQKHPRHRS